MTNERKFISSGAPAAFAVAVLFGLAVFSLAQAPTGAPVSGNGGATGASGATGSSGAGPSVSGSILAGIIPKGNPRNLEVESVVINDFAAFPSSITRPAGDFYLFLTNVTRQAPPNLQLVSVSLSATQATALAHTFNLQELNHVRRVAGIFSAPPGVYQLISPTTNKVFLTITIQQ